MSSTSTSSTAGKSCSKRNYFPSAFHPGEYDVVIGQGTKWYRHSGNKRLRKLVTSKLDEYLTATKSDKSYILSELLSQIKMNDNLEPSSKKGHFVRLENSVGLWVEVGDFQAKERISQTFRNALHEHYKSSSTSKYKRKRKRQIAAADVTISGPVGNGPWIEQTQLDTDNNSELLQSLFGMFDLEEVPSNLSLLNVASKLASFLPTSSILAQWFDNDINKKNNDEYDYDFFDDRNEFDMNAFILNPSLLA